jgi:hypothetical protein
LSEIDDEMAALSKPLVNGDTNGKLVLKVAVERDCAGALLVIKVVNESGTIAEDWAGSEEDCGFSVPRVKGGNKGDAESNKGEAGK